MTRNPSRMQVINDLVSTMALMVGVFIGCKSMGLEPEGITFVATTEFSVGSNNVTAYIEAFTASRSQSINVMTVARIR